MPEYQLVELDSGVHNYLVEMLQSGKELSQLILDKVRFEAGAVFTILPPNFSGNIHQYHTGGKLPPVKIGKKVVVVNKDGFKMVPIPNTNVALVKVTSEFLTQYPDSVCIFEDAMRLSTDPVLIDRIEKKDQTVFTLANSVYYCLTANSVPDFQTIENTIRASNSLWHFVCLLTLAGPTFTYNDKKMNGRILNEFVDQVLGIVFSAYDGESYIIWSEKNSFLEMLRGLFPV